jgi:uncharacterized protein
MSRPFLTARWDDVLLVSFRAPAELLQRYLPPALELDTPDAEPGLHLVSVVALRFGELRIHGLPIPTVSTFPEVNLRFYARHGDERGAVFLREYVPHPLVAAGARIVYNEPYRLAGVAHDVERDGAGSISSTTELRRRGRAGRIEVVAADAPITPAADSVEHWLKEHYWGFGLGRDGRTRRYRVDHPVWPTFPVREARIVDLDPGRIMGGRWAELGWSTQRHSIVLAEGSDAAIYPAERL